MPEVTGLRERRGRARVWIDGEFWAEIDAGVATECGVLEGAEFTDEELAGVRARGELALAMTRAFNLLGYRARSEGEIRTRLARHGHSDETIEEVVKRLRDYGYLDDVEFARAFARQKAEKYGPRRVSAELARAGLDREISRQAVEEQFDEESELEAASLAASRRYNTEEGSEAQARRVYGFLVRRGYSAGVCAEVAKGYRA